MNAGIDYVTQLTREDLNEIAAACNLEAGLGIVIEKREGCVRISVDQSQLKRWMWNFYRNGGAAVGPGDIDGVNIDAV